MKPGPEDIAFRWAITDLADQIEKVLPAIDRASDANQAFWDDRGEPGHRDDKIENDIEEMLSVADTKLREAEAFAHAAGNALATYLKQYEGVDYYWREQ